jgi:hypothetical protein
MAGRHQPLFRSGAVFESVTAMFDASVSVSVAHSVVNVETGVTKFLSALIIVCTACFNGQTLHLIRRVYLLILLSASYL